MTDLTDGWTLADEAAVPWQELGPGAEMKALGAANGRLIALFRFGAGYVGPSHEHADAEFSRSTDGATLVSVFAIPG
jgi:hypothetical protein